MGIEDMYARRMSSTNNFDGYSKNDKAPKTKLQSTKFKIGDKIVVKGEDSKIYLRGKIISLVKHMSIEGKIVKYSDNIRYPVGMKDVFVLNRNGKRDLNGEMFTAYTVD